MHEFWQCTTCNKTLDEVDEDTIFCDRCNKMMQKVAYVNKGEK